MIKSTHFILEGRSLETFAVSLLVPNVNAAIQIGTGIGCAGMYDAEQRRGLVVIADGRDKNPGASATNAITKVLQYLATHYGTTFKFADCRIAEIDSDGAFDAIETTWVAGETLKSVEFAPMFYGSSAPRTKEAFIGQFGAMGEQALVILAQAGPYG